MHFCLLNTVMFHSHGHKVTLKILKLLLRIKCGYYFFRYDMVTSSEIFDSPEIKFYYVCVSAMNIHFV